MKKNILIVLICGIVLISTGLYFLRLQFKSASMLGGISAHTTDISKLAEATSTPVVELKNGQTYDLVAEYVKKKIGDKEIVMLSYNGSIPGPTIKVEQGAEVNINFINHTNNPTTIHSHGLRLDSKYDGVVGKGQDAVKPGESFLYKIKFPDAGVFWYHPHLYEVSDQAQGLYGNYIVTPSDSSYFPPVNSEQILVLSDILLDQNGEKIPFPTPSSYALMGRYGNVLLANGKVIDSFNAKKGEIMRFYVTDSANARPFNIHIDNAKIKLVGSDLGRYRNETFVDNVILGPGERAIIDVYFPASGSYKIEHRTPLRTTTLALVSVSKDIPTFSFVKEFNILRTNKDITGEIPDLENYYTKLADKNISFSIDMGGSGMGGMMGGGMGMHRMPDGTMMSNGGMSMGGDSEKIEWEDGMEMMNAMSRTDTVTWKIIDSDTKQSNMDINWDFPKGKLVKIHVVNDPDSMHPMQHLFHLHGERFLVLATNGVREANPVWKDTLLVQKGDSVDLLVDMSNPGSWMGHCHISEHFESEMMLNFNVN